MLPIDRTSMNKIASISSPDPPSPGLYIHSANLNVTFLVRGHSSQAPGRKSPSEQKKERI